MAEAYDFSGWATRYNVKCSDGRTILPGAFKECDGMEVPIVWGHGHDGPKKILGRALLHETDEGVRMEGYFNNSDDGRSAKEGVAHRDIKYLSIYANRLKEAVGNVMYGKIREVSLVPFGGANPGAFIDNAVLAHGDGTYGIVEDEAVIFMGDEIDESVSHAEEKEEGKDMADEKEKKPERQVKDVLDEMTDEQKAVVDYLMREAAREAVEGNGDDDDEAEEKDESVKHADEEKEDGGKNDMKYNAFEGAPKKRSGVISHSDQEAILSMAKESRIGTFKEAMKVYAEENYLMHDDEEPAADPTPVPETSMYVGGFDDTTNMPGESITSFKAILPEYKDLHSGAPQLVTDDMGWVDVVMRKTHKSPISRIRTGQVDIREAETEGALRAKGYQKGNKKQLTGNIKMARRTTDPQTVYVRNELHRDDIVDITDFDYVSYLYNIDRMMLNQEVAQAILFGDGRDDADADKIFPEHIRPIWTDDDLYTIHYELDKEAMTAELQGTDTDTYFGANFIAAEAMVNACLYAREDFKGSGQPDMFIDPHYLNVMLLARDRNGHRLYSGVSELATALNVGTIYTCEKMKNKTRTKGEGQAAKTVKLDALICNLSDYQIGSTKGGEVTHFTQFDIDFNKQKSLLETRISGALTKIYSAIAIEEEVTNP